MPGQLFTEYFLSDGIRLTPERRGQGSTFAAFRDGARGVFAGFGSDRTANEAETEQELIRPLLELLGWTNYLPQQSASGGEDIPDLLLFGSAEAKARASGAQGSAYLEAIAVAELKRFHRPLDTRGTGGGPRASSPHAQILRYLATADSVTDGQLRWGVLTNGGVWRLYDQKTRPRATAFYEADLEALLNADDEDGLRAFHLLFRRAAFVRRPGAAATFLETALAEGRRYEERVAQSLAGVVFDRVFPRLLQALADATDQPMPQIREAALIFLYRLLFVLYAEDRGLLPVNDAAYDDYGLRKRVRDDVAARKARNDTFSSAASSYYDHLSTLFHLIDRGDPSIGLPPYNGGLFAEDAAELLNQVRLPDDVIADVVYDLSHTQTDGQPGYVNYRDMSVQQLGSIYERLLEQEPVRDAEGKVRIRPNPYARKDSGSFYTPQDLVDLIVEQTLKPLVEERLAAFEARAGQLRGDRRPRAERRAELARLDPAEAVLDLKVLDPAMGSGHFLVSAVDFLTDYIADLIEYAPAVADWLDGDDAYHSPLLDRVAAIRADILQRAAESKWVVNEAQLTDQAIIRRLVLKRCIYGVDKNPLTVELAKVSLWLHSFTVGAPLSFLDHHLRRGDSLIGLRVADANEELRRLHVPMFVASALQGVENAAQGMRQIEQLSDADVAEVHQSESLFKAVESATADLRGFLDTLGGLRWLTAGMRVRQRAIFESPLTETLAANPTQAFPLLTHGHATPVIPASTTPSSVGAASQTRPSSAQTSPPAHPIHGEPVLSLAEGPARSPSQGPTVRGEPGRSPSQGRVEPQSQQHPSPREPDPAFRERWTEARSAADEQSFLHWEAAFPGVWRRWQDATPEGGFDAVIGNPPWDRIKLQEVEWFATRDPELARAPTAAARRDGIRRLRELDDPLAHAFDQAKAHADRLGQVVRASGHYPLLGGGDINLYSLFVERSLRLVKPGGLVGLLTPSGIYADKTAARFFKSVSTTGRVAGIYDFENRRLGTDLPPFFADIDSRFKFCALIVGGPQRRFPETNCGFFLPDTQTIADPDRAFTLTPDDFARVNPNTGTAPIFRTRRDADLTRRIYQTHPVLVDRSGDQVCKAWPIQHLRQFDVTNDSHLFRTAAQLEADGFYPVQANRWKRGKELYLPLYEGKMANSFDHRTASVVLNPHNLMRPGQPQESTLEELMDPSFMPRPAFWVPAEHVSDTFPEEMGWTLVYRRITAPTNARTTLATILPWCGVSYTIPMLRSRGRQLSALDATCLQSVLASICLDYVSRQKLQGTSMSLTSLEQLPVIAPKTYDRRFGDVTAADLVRDHVLRLTYTAHDMAPFARDLGHQGPPFPWDEEDRRHLRARLDACYFHLYGLSRDDAAYILDTFPIIQRQDQAQFGHYRTKALILAYMNALTAGDTDEVVSV